MKFASLAVRLVVLFGLLIAFSGCPDEEEDPDTDAGQAQEDTRGSGEDGSASDSCDPCPMERGGYVCGPKYSPSSSADDNGDDLVCRCSGYCKELTGAACVNDPDCVVDNADGCRKQGPFEPEYNPC